MKKIALFCLLALVTLFVSSCKKDCLANDYLGGFSGTLSYAGYQDTSVTIVFTASTNSKEEATLVLTAEDFDLFSVICTINKDNSCQINEGQTVISYGDTLAIQSGASFSLNETGTTLSGGFTAGSYSYTFVGTRQ